MTTQKFHVCVKCGRKRPENYLVLLGTTWNGDHWICNPKLEEQVKNSWWRRDRYCDNLAKPGNFYEKLRTWCAMLIKIFPDLAPPVVAPPGVNDQVGKSDISVSDQARKKSSKPQPGQKKNISLKSRPGQKSKPAENVKPGQRLPGKRQPGSHKGARRSAPKKRK